MKNIIKNKKINIEKLINFGFKQTQNDFTYTKKIKNNQFELTIIINKPATINTKLIEIETQDEYTLHLTNEQGDFVGAIRTEYNKTINDIVNNCFENDIFKSSYTKKLLNYVYNKYQTQPEYLWEKFPDNAILRRKDNSKWYGAILTVKKDKFGYDSKENVEIINLRIPKNSIDTILKQKNIYPAYHMNKKNWVSIILDGSVKIENIYNMIDESYILTK